jgi:hypothetical protein
MCSFTFTCDSSKRVRDIPDNEYASIDFKGRTITKWRISTFYYTSLRSWFLNPRDAISELIVGHHPRIAGIQWQFVAQLQKHDMCHYIDFKLSRCLRGTYYQNQSHSRLMSFSNNLSIFELFDPFRISEPKARKWQELVKIYSNPMRNLHKWVCAVAASLRLALFNQELNSVSWKTIGCDSCELRNLKRAKWTRKWFEIERMKEICFCEIIIQRWASGTESERRYWSREWLITVVRWTFIPLSFEIEFMARPDEIRQEHNQRIISEYNILIKLTDDKGQYSAEGCGFHDLIQSCDGFLNLDICEEFWKTCLTVVFGSSRTW